MADALGPLVLIGLAALVFLALWRRQHKADEARRRAKAEAYDERERDKAAFELLREIDRYFPFLRDRYRLFSALGEPPQEAFSLALKGIEAVDLGTTFYGLPARLPLAERRKHLYVVGTTGAGKTTLLLHIIKDDLEAGRGVCVIGPEADFFRDWLLPMVPEERAEELIYFAPGNPKNPVAFNPLALEDGEDRAQAADELFSIFKRTVGEEEFGQRMSPILANAFGCLMGRPGATLWDVKRLFEDAAYRKEVAASAEDEYARDYILKIYPTLPKGSHLPLVNRLDHFLRPPALRRTFCHPESSFSIRRVLADGKILFVDLSGLTSDSVAVVGQMLLSRFQLELMRREAIAEELREPFYVFAEEFADYAGLAEGTWRALLSRGRRFGLALTLSHQRPGQLPHELRDEILGVVNSQVVFGQGAKDAELLRRNLLEEGPKGARPLQVESFVTLRTGQAIARLGTGAFAVPLRTLEPLAKPEVWVGEKIRAISWESFGTSPWTETPGRQLAKDQPLPAKEDFLE